jgi:O-antigen/teichoic acid export membrane protein
MSPKDFAYRLLSTPNELIFKEGSEHQTAEFFLSTSYVAIGTLFGSALTFIFLILGARILGPQGFGDLSLVMSISLIAAISMGLNLVATVNYASGIHDDSVRTRTISTSSIEALLLVTASMTVFALLSPQLSYLLGVSAAAFLFAVAYGMAVTCYTFAMNALRVIFSVKAYALSAAAQS